MLLKDHLPPDGVTVPPKTKKLPLAESPQNRDPMQEKPMTRVIGFANRRVRMLSRGLYWKFLGGNRWVGCMRLSGKKEKLHPGKRMSYSTW